MAAAGLHDACARGPAWRRTGPDTPAPHPPQPWRSVHGPQRRSGRGYSAGGYSGVNVSPRSANRSRGASVPEVGARVDGLAADQDLVVEVGAGRAAGVAGPGDEAAALDALAGLDVEAREVAVERAHVLAVVEDDRGAVFLMRAGEDHGAVGRGVDRGAALGADVHAAVELEPGGPRGVARAELGVHGAADRPARRQRRHRLT